MDVALTVMEESGVRCVCEPSAAVSRVMPLRPHCVLTRRARVPLRRESTMRTMQEALQEAEKYASRCEALAALAVVGRGVLEQAQTEHSERARAAAAEAAAAAAVEATAKAAAAAQRLQMEQELAALALRMQEMQAQLGVAPPAAPQLEEELCVVCMDAPKQHIILPCGHQCVCEACAQQLTQTTSPSCPVCRAPIRETTRVYR